MSDDPDRPPTRLAGARVAEAMHHGLLSCRADETLADAARKMCAERVHMLAVRGERDGSLIGTISDMALLEGLLDDAGAGAALGALVEREPAAISSDAPLEEAVQLMRTRGVGHLLVRDAHSGRPVGVVSTLDLAGLLAATPS